MENVARRFSVSALRVVVGDPVLRAQGMEHWGWRMEPWRRWHEWTFPFLEVALELGAGPAYAGSPTWPGTPQAVWDEWVRLVLHVVRRVGGNTEQGEADALRPVVRS